MRSPSKLHCTHLVVDCALSSRRKTVFTLLRSVNKALVAACVPALFPFVLLMPLVDYSVPKNIGLCPCLCSACCAISARVRYSTALPHLLLFVIFLISHVYYICYFLLTMSGHQGNAGILSHVISCQLPKTVISFLYPIMFKKSIL